MDSLLRPHDYLVLLCSAIVCQILQHLNIKCNIRYLHDLYRVKSIKLFGFLGSYITLEYIGPLFYILFVYIDLHLVVRL